MWYNAGSQRVSALIVEYIEWRIGIITQSFRQHRSL